MKKFNYNTIYKNYKKNLLYKLRAFGESDDLSLWVANEDITISVLNLIDALELEKFQIEFDASSFKCINKKFLEKKLINEGNLIFDHTKKIISFSRQNKIFQISVPKNVKKINKKIHRDKEIILEKVELLKNEYSKNLKKIKINPCKEIKSNLPSTLIYLKYKDNKCKLNLSVNPSNHLVVDCNFFILDKKNIILNKFGNLVSQEIFSLPINEAKDHLLIKIESLLRPKKIPKQTGIILKNSGGEIFVYFQRLINQLYNEYLKITKVKFGTNFFDKKIPEDWLNISEKIKINEIQKSLEIFNKENFKKTSLKLEKILNSNRLFFSLNNSQVTKFDNSLFMKLEKFLNNRFDVKFEVYYVNRKDENTLRSL
tara:strand:- start:263 stop:1372 length:1110 start_codon:yes stop_codon:yes gene_type:complete